MYKRQEQPEEAAEEAEATADAELDEERQAEDLDPQNVFNPETGSTHT